jgi:hypothetical protein
MTPQWPSPPSLETGLHANHSRTQTSSIANPTTAQGASWPVVGVLPTLGKCVDRMARYKMIQQRGTARTVTTMRSSNTAGVRASRRATSGVGCLLS